MRPRVATVLSLGLLLLAAQTAAAQDRELNRLLEQLAAHWARGDAAGVASLAAGRGVSIDLDGGAFGPIGARQAAAVLRRILDEHETVSVDIGQVRVVGGRPPRAFGEFAWTARVRRTTIPERTTVFVAFLRDERGWRITQIRLIR